MQPLKPLTLDLQGQILIEASAGTGKTYTIGLLFLRLLLEQNLSVDEILVVTFTKAATEELRGRVRQRIRDALDVLEGQEADDEPLQDLLALVVDKERATILLSDALTRMDEAAIFTIHGFCQRMLQEHAFESGAPFEMEFLETEQLLRNRIMEDFWRLHFYPVGREEAAWAASLWNSPQDLLAGLGGHLSRPEVECLPVISAVEMAQQEAALALMFLEVQTLWQQHRDKIVDLLQTNKRISKNNSTGYGAARLATAVEEMDCFVGAEKLPWVQPEILELFTTSKINNSLLKNKNEPPDHSFFYFFEQFFQAHHKLTQSRKFAVLLAARDNLTKELVRRKKEQDQLYFDDLLTQLDAGLQAKDGGRQLAQSIGKRFPVIMVDEFQDTDPLQYRIFAAIHANTKPTAIPAGLFLIGDPKQAIYSFRGADIFTYIQARKDTPADNRLTMDTNYRSTSPMVAAVNQLFDRDASFLFAKNEIDFTPVKAAALADSKPILINGIAPPALTCLLLPEGAKGKPLPKGTASEQSARFCACEIAELLAAGLAGKAVIGEQSLNAGDIAVLVRTHLEADLVRTELNALGITSVYYSQNSVFSSNEAQQMLTVMTALANLSDSALVRTALAGDLFGYTAEQLDRLRSDEQEWEKIIAAMNRYQLLWQQQGFTPMFQQLLAEQQVVSRLHGVVSGERMLTNFLHLTELLQEAAQQQIGAEGLLRWFSDQIQGSEEQADSRQLRLESDENLVKIVTIHKSKGMEYPVVFLPFLWSARACKKDEPLAFHRPEQPDRLFVDLGTGNEEHYKLAERERLASDLRLLYVAITRARYCCFFCWGRVSKMEESGLCYLLHGNEIPDDAQLISDLDSLSAETSALLIKPFPDNFSAPDLRGDDQAAPLTVARFKGHIDNHWQITSYSRLTAHKDPQPERPDYDRIISEEPQVPGHDVFGFPKGAAAGTCLHTILEQISFTDPAGHEEVITTQLARAGFADTWIPVVTDWMQAISKTGLAGNGEENDLFSLAQLTEQDRVNEMSFYFPLESMQLSRFNRVLKDFDYAPLPEQYDTLQGLMVGFIDLVFCYNGRYYVADYKSNHLGSQAADYQQDKLETAMVDHRYDLQYLIYTLALHRFLAGRIRGYDYATHVGGVLYLFLRGMNPEYEPGTGVFTASPPLELINRLDRCCAGQEDC